MSRGEGSTATLGALPWVRKVAVRRSWPDRLDVAIEEHVVLARWGEDRLVNIQGEVFEGGAEESERRALPLLFGPAASEHQVAERFGYSHGAFRQLVGQFRSRVAAGHAPPFSSRKGADARPERPPVPLAPPRSPNRPTPAS